MNKQLMVEELANAIKKAKGVAIVSLERLPSNQLKIIRNSITNLNLWIRPKNILRRALIKSGYDKLVEHLVGSCALLLLNDDVFKLSVKLSNLRTNIFVKPGMIVKSDVSLEPGPTTLMPGEEMTLLTSMGVKVNPKGGKVTITEPAVILRAGETVKPVIADLLFKLGVKPVSVGLDLIAAFIENHLFTAGELTVNVDEWLSNLAAAFVNARNLSINASIINKSSINSLLMKAYSSARSLARETGFFTKDNADEVMFTAKAKALALAETINWEVKE